MRKARFRVVGFSFNPATGEEWIQDVHEAPARRWSYKARHVKKWMKQGGCHRVTKQLVRY